MLRLTIALCGAISASAYTDPGTFMFSDTREVSCHDTQAAYQHSECCVDPSSAIDLISSTGAAISESRLATILKRGYLIAGVWNRNFHTELDGDLYKNSAHKDLFPDIDNNPMPVYTYVLKTLAKAEEPSQTWEFDKVMLDTTPKKLHVDNDMMVTKYSHELPNGTWVHHKGVYAHPDSLYPALIAKALGVGLQLVPFFNVQSDPTWFGQTHLLARGLVDMIGNTITPKVARNFQWQALALPAHSFSNDVMVVQKSVLETCAPSTFYPGSPAYEKTKANTQAAIACLDGKPFALGIEGTTCYEAFGDLCDSAAVSKNPVGTAPEDYCTISSAVGIASGAYTVDRVRNLCPERFIDTVTYTVKRDLLNVMTYPDQHLNMFGKSVLDMMKYAYKVGEKGRADPDIGLPTSSDNVLLTTYEDKQLVLHGNEVLSTYGNIKEAYEIIGLDVDQSLPVIYEEWYF